MGLILELAGGVAEDVLVVAGQAPVLTGEVALSGDHVRRLLGSSISDDDISVILRRLGLGGPGRRPRAGPASGRCHRIVKTCSGRSI